MVGAGVGAAGLAVAAACGDDGGNGTSPTATGVASATATPMPPVRGGRYKSVTSVGFDTLDPHISIAGATVWFPRLYNVLVNR